MENPVHRNSHRSSYFDEQETPLGEYYHLEFCRVVLKSCVLSRKAFTCCSACRRSSSTEVRLVNRANHDGFCGGGRRGDNVGGGDRKSVV